jgi:hypothetical protein
MVSATALRTLAFLVFVVTVPVAAFGQPAIGGIVSDPSGAPMAGALVEASSTALIEKTRKTLTDAAGRYRLEDLVPGTYRVRFTLQGWKPYQREGVELAGSFTAVVNAELAVCSDTSWMLTSASSEFSSQTLAYGLRTIETARMPDGPDRKFGRLPSRGWCISLGVRVMREPRIEWQDKSD